MNKKTTHWRLETDADGVAWLAGQGRRVDQQPVARRHGRARCDARRGRTSRPKGVDRHFGEARLHRRRRHQGIRRHSHARPGVRADSPGSAGARQARSTALPHDRPINGFALGGGLEVALACYRVLVDDPAATLGFPKCSSACIQGSAARCAPCISPARSLRWI